VVPSSYNFYKLAGLLPTDPEEAAKQGDRCRAGNPSPRPTIHDQSHSVVSNNANFYMNAE